MKLIVILLLAAIAGCANYQPIVDTKGVDMNRYTADLGECQQFAGQVDPARNAAAGAAGGAALGAVIGALLGNRQTAGQGAAIYGLLGAGAGGAQGVQAQRNIVRNCMSGRGYKVLQ